MKIIVKNVGTKIKNEDLDSMKERNAEVSLNQLEAKIVAFEATMALTRVRNMSDYG